MATSLEDRPGRQVTETLLDAVISVEAPHDVRLTAAWSLRDRPDRAITDALLATLHDCTDPQTRWYLLRALATRPGQDVTDALLHALTSGEEDSHARRVQALELRDRPEPKVTAALREALKDPDMTVRRSAAGALTDRLEPSITDALLEALDDDEPDVRKSAVEALSSREDPRVTAKLVDALDDPDYDVAAAAAQALYGQQTREVTEALIKALTADTNTESVPTHALWRRPFVRSAAATALAAHPGLSVTNGLLSAATDHASGVRQAAVTALRGRRGVAATTALLNALSDRERLVRNAAVQSLRDRTGPEITLWQHSQADNVAVEPSLLYAVAANASRLWATWPRDNRNELLSAIAHVTEAVTAPDRRT